jgi:type II secretory pathway component GspD/PulD (secretin)
VIGGINQVKEQTKHDATPGVANVPLLGWLFRRNEVSSETQELFIFITPRILGVRP